MGKSVMKKERTWEHIDTFIVLDIGVSTTGRLGVVIKNRRIEQMKNRSMPHTPTGQVTHQFKFMNDNIMH